MSTHKCRETPPGLHWSSSRLTNESKCFVLRGRPIIIQPGCECLLWVGRVGTVGNVMTRQPTRTHEKPERHTMLVESCLSACVCVCVWCTFFYETVLWWSAQIVTDDENILEDFYKSSAVNQCPGVSAICCEEARLLCEHPSAVLATARMRPPWPCWDWSFYCLGCSAVQSSCQHIEPNVVFM